MDNEQAAQVSDTSALSTSPVNLPSTDAGQPRHGVTLPAEQIEATEHQGQEQGTAEHFEPLQYEHTWEGASAPPSVEMPEQAPISAARSGAPISASPTAASPPPILPGPQRKKRRKKRRWLRVVLAVALALLVLLGGAAAYGYYYFETNIQKPLSTMIRPVQRSADEPQLDRPIPTDSTVAGRVWNVLLLGSDNDQKFNFPAVLTQVMMVVHIDTIHNTVTMLSIPRDSWVYVPEIGGMHKIDQAFLLGAQQNNSFDNGVRLARLTIEQDYGIPIDRYAWVGLNGFVKVINTLGGVNINVTHPIVDDAYPRDTGNSANSPYSYQRLYLAPGPQHLNGEQALEYVRSRHADLVGDIGRTQRQQQILEALKPKLNADTLLTDIPQLLSDMSGYLYTDISEQEMLGFALFGRNFPTNQIKNITLGPGPGSQNYGNETNVYDPSVGSGQSVIIPNCQNIQPVVNRLFGLGNKQTCNVGG
ncbi:MAG TPA: LCP family protein [Ktedonobacteraceae bacterium]|nr:LCP family protein [Ktedonobacteraceae bacterium]